METKEIKQLLKNVYENYQMDSKTQTHLCYKTKCYGAMEALLIVLGVLGRGQPFDYTEVEYSFRLFWIINIEKKRKETYFEHMDRMIVKTIY